MFVVKHSSMFNVQRVQYVNCKNFILACSESMRYVHGMFIVKHSNMFNVQSK